ncbi:MAG TPA: XRE family transcriptional regulator [Phaeodactylibacter sp.]|nr:XRE family transcriptional regulator [Phaeodactylibacter sp.]
MNKEACSKNQVAAEPGIGHTNNNKLENDNREPSAKELQALARLFYMPVGQVLNFVDELPKEVTKKYKRELDLVELIKQLNEDEPDAVYRIIDTMLTKKVQGFFPQKCSNSLN